MKNHLVPVLLTASFAVGACGGSPESHNPSTTIPDIAQATVDATRYFDGMDHLKPGPLKHERDNNYSLEAEIVPDAIRPPLPEVTRTVLDAIVRVEGVYTEGEYEGRSSKGSGFLMADQTTGSVELMTAGHVVANHDMQSLKIVDNKGATMAYTGVAAYHQKNKYVDTGSEDMAVIHPKDADSLRGRSLKPRDVAAEPLKGGEQLFFFNFQKEHEPGNPAVYTAIYGGDIDKTQFMSGIGDLMPGVEEDDARSGGSGGVVTDSLGRVAALLSNSDSRGDIPCGQPYYGYGRRVPIGSSNVLVLLQPTIAIEECVNGLNEIHMRKINQGGTFRPIAPAEKAAG